MSFKAAEPVGPEVCINENKDIRADEPGKTVHCGEKIQGTGKQQVDMGHNFFFCHLHAGGG